jgi:hypothetical protein
MVDDAGESLRLKLIFPMNVYWLTSGSYTFSEFIHSWPLNPPMT